jgi:hypothetical protein
VEPVDGGGERRPAEPELDGLVEVGQGRPGQPGQHGQPAIGRRRRGKGARHGQADQPVGHGHLQEPALAAPLTPVRHRVEDEVRRQADREGGQRAAGQPADQRSRQDVIGQQH